MNKIKKGEPVIGPRLIDGKRRWICWKCKRIYVTCGWCMLCGEEE